MSSARILEKSVGLCLALLLLLSIGNPVQAAYWRGLYRAGAEVNSFQPCPGNLVYWVDGGGPVALSLREYALKHVQRPYQPFYVEVVGELLGRRTDGAAAGYDDVLRLHSVEAISQQLPVVCQNLPPEG